MPTAAPDTDELLDLCEQGDATARDRLLDRHRGRLRRMIDAHLDPRLAGRLDSSDVVQDTLAAAARKLPKYLRERPLPFYPWLRQIAFDRLVELHRRHIQAGRRSVRRESPLAPHLPDDSVADLARRIAGQGSSPSAHAVRQELFARVRAAIDSLPPADRELILLRHVEQLPLKDIAAILGTTEGAARTRHFRILQRLHNMLSEEQSGE